MGWKDATPSLANHHTDSPAPSSANCKTHRMPSNPTCQVQHSHIHWKTQHEKLGLGESLHSNSLNCLFCEPISCNPATWRTYRGHSLGALIAPTNHWSESIGAPRCKTVNEMNWVATQKGAWILWGPGHDAWHVAGINPWTMLKQWDRKMWQREVHKQMNYFLLWCPCVVRNLLDQPRLGTLSMCLTSLGNQ